MFNVYDLSWEDILRACEIGNQNFYAQFNNYYQEYNADSNVGCVQSALDQMAALRQAYKEALLKRYTENKEEYDRLILEGSKGLDF